MDMNLEFETGRTKGPEEIVSALKESLFGDPDFTVNARGEAGLLIFYMSLIAPTPTSEGLAIQVFEAILKLVDAAKLDKFIAPDEAYRMIIKGWETRKGIVENG